MPINRPIEVIPSIPNQDVPLVIEVEVLDGQGNKTTALCQHPDWRLFNQKMKDSLVWNGEDIIFQYVSETDATLASVDQRVTTNATDISANAELITTLRTDVDGNVASIQTNATAISNEATARAEADTALRTDVDGNTADIATNATAISDEATARARADTALQASVDTNTADISTNAQAIVDEASARASAISTLEVTVNGFSASIQATSDLVVDLEGVVEALATFEIDVNGTVTGYQIDGVRSDIVFAANQFSIKTQDGTLTPFSVSGNTVTMQNVQIDGNLVVAGTITGGSGGSLAAETVETGNIAQNAVVASEFTEVDGAGSLVGGGYNNEDNGGTDVPYSTFSANPLSYTPQITHEFSNTTGGTFLIQWRVNYDEDGNLLTPTGGNADHTFIIERPDATYVIVRYIFAAGLVEAIATPTVTHTTAGTFKVHFYRDEDFQNAQLTAILFKR